MTNGTNGTNGTNEANETNTTADSNDAAGGRPVIKFGTDGWRAVVGKDFNFEKSDVLRFVFEDGSYFAIRPSGTEPKCKIYFSICAETKQEVEEKYEKISKFILTKAEQYFN